MYFTSICNECLKNTVVFSRLTFIFNLDINDDAINCSYVSL